MDKSSAVRAMFDKLAPYYDLANTVMSAGMDTLWRQRAVRMLAAPKDGRVLDLCCGTGPLTRLLAKSAPRGSVVGVDFSEAMLAVARRRPLRNVEYVQADVLGLPFPAQSFDGATMGFSLRNVTDIPRALREIARVLRPGARFVNLEVSKPQNRVVRDLFYLYFFGLVPLVGGFVGRDRAAYRYLPQSLVNFPDAKALAELFRENQFTDVRYVSLMGGVTTLHAGSAPVATQSAPVPSYAGAAT